MRVGSLISPGMMLHPCLSAGETRLCMLVSWEAARGSDLQVDWQIAPHLQSLLAEPSVPAYPPVSLGFIFVSLWASQCLPGGPLCFPSLGAL